MRRGRAGNWVVRKQSMGRQPVRGGPLYYQEDGLEYSGAVLGTLESTDREAKTDDSREE